MATQSRAGTSKRQTKGSGRAGTSRRGRISRTAAPEMSGGTPGSASVAVAPGGRERSTDGASDTTRAARKQQAAPATRGRFGVRTEGLQKTLADTRAELRRVSWPDKETTQNLTLVVIAISLALGLLLGGIDFILFEIFQAFA